MKAQRDELPISEERGRKYLVPGVVGVIALALLLYFVLREPAQPVAEAPGQVIRDGALVAPAAIITAETPAPAPATPDTADFNERQLGPPRTAVGAGAATVAAEAEDGEAFVIDGDLLEELEEDAETPPPPQ